MTYSVIAIFLLGLLSFANGANDVSKAIATLAGAKVTSVKKAVIWGSSWTFLGSVSGLYWGTAIIKNITQNIYTTQPTFSFAMAISIGLAPAVWVLLATWRKWPVSTTHAVVGGLLGSGVVSLGISGIAWHAIFFKIALPLLVSPILAIGLAYLVSPFLKKNIKYRVNFGMGISVDHMHWLSSGLLSFSRGLNDTPKLIAVMLPLVLAGAMASEIMSWLFLVSAVAMMVGGLAVGSRITKVLGFKVTELDHAQGFAANAISTLLVLFASKLGLPVSTTHVSASSIMGLGLSDGQGLNKRTVWSMVFAWGVTIPITAAVAVFLYKVSEVF